MICTTMEQLQNELRKKVKETEQEGKSVRAVARQTGISETLMNYFKNDERNMKFENLHKLAEYYGVKYILKN